MNNVFNRLQALETSNYCGKFSKSVSYETLVIGAATTGTDIKQTQRLSKGSANKPLSAVGTLTSLLNNSVKVVEKWLQTLPVFRLVKVLGLVAVLSVGITAETSADDEKLCQTYKKEEVTCIDKLSDENGNNSCGDNCTYKVIVENGQQVLHVYKVDISKPATIRDGAFSPNYYEGKQVLDASGKPLPLSNIMLDNDFENIKREAFAFSGAQISSASGKFVLDNAGPYIALYGGTTLNGDVIFNYSPNSAIEVTPVNGDVIISEGVTDISQWAFNGLELNGNLIIPSSVKMIGGRAFHRVNITGKIYCASGIENCYNMIKDGCKEKEDRLTSLENLLNSNKFSAYPDGCLSMGAKARCTKCKSASFKLEDDGWCLRKIYTPAEAAEVLKDDNTNSVVITFKK